MIILILIIKVRTRTITKHHHHHRKMTHLPLILLPRRPTSSLTILSLITIKMKNRTESSSLFHPWKKRSWPENQILSRPPIPPTTMSLFSWPPTTISTWTLPILFLLRQSFRMVIIIITNINNFFTRRRTQLLLHRQFSVFKTSTINNNKAVTEVQLI